jgi:hypothetical protein
MSAISIGLLTALPAEADLLLFSTGDPDGLMATASRPAGNGKIEIESADDFALTSSTRINSATFTGLLTGGASASDVSEVRVEIYRIFPDDSNTARTPKVPTRANSPSDIALLDRDSVSGNLTFTTGTLNTSFTANNSVLNGINKSPDQTTGGEGSVTGDEVQFNVKFTTPIDLPTGHYFFIPQVLLSNAADEFMWLSAPRPIVSPPGTPFPAGVTDLQSWIRNENLAPDWLRIGQDIVGGSPFPTFNATFSLSGQTIPEPASIGLLGAALSAMAVAGLRRRRQS